MAASDDIFDDSKPANDAWTGMLGISLVALLAGCLFLYLDWSQYPSNLPPVPKAPPAQAPGK